MANFYSSSGKGRRWTSECCEGRESRWEWGIRPIGTFSAELLLCSTASSRPSASPCDSVANFYSSAGKMMLYGFVQAERLSLRFRG